MINVIKNKSIFLGIAGILTIVSVAAILTFGFKLGIDFTGGSMWHLKIEGTTSEEVSKAFTDDLNLEVSNVSYDAPSGTYSITFPQITDAERQEKLSALKTRFGADNVQEAEFLSISASVSEEIKNKAMTAIAFVVLGISLYIAFVFRQVSRPISSWKYGVITLVTLLHDVMIPAGVAAVLSRYMNVPVDTNFIVALLVVMGFSVHDTIVVFDRIRENLIRSRTRNFSEIINSSVNETIRRSINTSLTLILVLIALFFLGPVSLKYFILTILIGVTVGTYSSIFVASPLLVIWERLSNK